MPALPRCKICLLALAAGGTLAWTQDAHIPSAAEVQKKVSEWVLTRKLISAEDAAWQSEKASLTDLNAIRIRGAP